MTLDTSAVIAILFGEPGYLELVDRVLEADMVRIGAPTLAEALIVASSRKGASAEREVRRLLEELGVSTVAFDERHAAEATRAYVQFGRGRHRAGLNFGDCLSYAVASVTGDPLLYVGQDFTQTDIAPA